MRGASEALYGYMFGGSGEWPARCTKFVFQIMRSRAYGFLGRNGAGDMCRSLPICFMRNTRNVWTSPPYAIPYGCGIPNPIYWYGYGVGIMRLVRMVVDLRSEIGESGSEKKWLHF